MEQEEIMLKYHLKKSDVHEINATVFVSSIETLNAILFCIKHSDPNGKVRPLTVKASKEGSFETFFTLAGLLGFLQTPIGKEFYHGLTGFYPEKHSKKVGELLRQFVISLYMTKNDKLLPLVKKYNYKICLLYTSPSPRDGLLSRMPSSA